MLRRFLITSGILLISSPALAQTLPGPADAGRVNLETQRPALTEDKKPQIEMPALDVAGEAPEGAENIHFFLKDINIEGVTIFKAEALSSLYTPHTGKDVTLDVVWKIASAITAQYRDQGYFLSRAYVPEQSIKEGVVTIKVVEGYIGVVDGAGEASRPTVVQNYIDQLLARKPVTAYEVESFLLRLNDLPGITYRAVLSPVSPDAGLSEGSVRLTLTPQPDNNQGYISFDNYGSRFLGPHEVTAAYEMSFVPLQQTSFTILSDVRPNELKHGTVRHSVVVAPACTLIFDGGYTKAYPGDTLKDFDIESRSVALGVGIEYQWIRQRTENLAVSFTLDGRNTDSDLLDSRLTKDRVRAIRLKANYENSAWKNGYNVAEIKLSQGLEILNSSEKGDLDLSRSEAVPDFTKIEISAARVQALSELWLLKASLAGQYSSDPLYSSEEFGYGGQNYGRAYDSSEITGDHGINAGIEIQYAGFKGLKPVQFFPYVFYDIGKVWNKDSTQVNHESGSSVGFGIRFDTDFKLSGNFGIAIPLTRKISNPIYGENDSNPRILLEISQKF